MEHFVARSGVGQRQQVNQFVGSGAQDDPRRIQTVQGGQTGTQIGAGTVGIAVQTVGNGAMGDDCLRAGTEGAFVR